MHPLRQQRTDDAGENVAGSRGGQATITVRDHQHLTRRFGHHRGGTFQQAHAIGVGRQPTRARDAIVRWRIAEKIGVLAVVRCEHRARASGSNDVASSVSAPRHREQSVTVDDDGNTRRGNHLACLEDGAFVASETGSDDHGLESRVVAVDLLQNVGRPTQHGKCLAHHFDGCGAITGDSGRGRVHHSGPRPHGRRGAQIRRTHHPGTARQREHGRLPFVSVERSPRKPTTHIGHLDFVDVDVAHAEVDADIGQLDLAAESGSRPQQKSGFQRHERDRAIGRPRSGGCETGETVETARNVDRQYRHTVRRWRTPIATKAGSVGGIDDEIARRQTRRHPIGVDHDDPHALVGQQTSGHPTIGSVVPLAGHHHDRATVETAHHALGGPGHGGTSATDEHLHGRAVGDGLGIEHSHLLRSEHRAHG